MVASALSANRALAVLDWIVGHSGEAFTLSELSRALGINIPSLMSVLQSLADAGYLTRHATRKTYEAGPALLAIGLVVSAHHPVLGILHQEVAALASAVDSECFAAVIVGQRSVVVADAGRPGKKALPVRVGHRYPLMAPVGHVFLAWAPPAEAEDWIARAEGPGVTIDRARMARELQGTRERGYMAALYEDVAVHPPEVIEVLTELPQDTERSESVRRAVAAFGKGWEMLDPRPGQRYDVSNVSAPIFNAQGKVVMTVVINGFSQIEGGELLKRIERLLQTTRLLTKHGGGVEPGRG